MKLHDIHVFGCPIYVLQKKLADGMSIPRWERRSKRGMYVGMSSKHAGNVPLVLNFETGNITAQWNVVFDDWFSTIATNVDDMPDFHANEWSNMFGTSTYDLETSEQSEEVVKQPTMETRHEIENDEMDEEDLVRRIREHNPLIQPTRSKPERTYSQATVESIRNPITQTSS